MYCDCVYVYYNMQKIFAYFHSSHPSRRASSSQGGTKSLWSDKNPKNFNGRDASRGVPNDFQESQQNSKRDPKIMHKLNEID